MNIVHFDLKSANLLLDGPLHPPFLTDSWSIPLVKVADFGLSKHKLQPVQLTSHWANWAR